MATGRASRAATAGGEQERQLVVLADGPWARCWYWRDDLEAMQQASRNVGYSDTHPAAVLRPYQPTDQHQAHPHNEGRSGRVYRFGPAQEVPGAGQAAAEVVRARAAVTTAVVPAPRRSLDDEIAERQRRTQHEQHAEREGVLW